MMIIKKEYYNQSLQFNERKKMNREELHAYIQNAILVGNTHSAHDILSKIISKIPELDRVDLFIDNWVTFDFSQQPMILWSLMVCILKSKGTKSCLQVVSQLIK